MQTKQFSLGHFSMYSEMNFSKSILEKLDKLISLISDAEKRQNVPKDYRYSKLDVRETIPTIISDNTDDKDIMENAQSLELIKQDIQNQMNYLDNERRMVYSPLVLEVILNQFKKILTDFNNVLEKDEITELEIDVTSLDLDKSEIIDVIVGNTQTTITIENSKVKISTYGDIVNGSDEMASFIIPPASTIDL